MNYLDGLKYKDISEVLWVNISTCPVTENLTEDNILFEGWEQKINWDNQIDDVAEILKLFPKEAGKYKEFSKITSISYGRIKDGKLKVKNLTNKDEARLLTEFLKDASSFFGGGVKFIGGFNPVNFELPFIQFRCWVNSVEDSRYVDLAGLKPWNIKHVISVQEIARSTSSTGISLQGLTGAFGIILPKTEQTPEKMYLASNFKELESRTNDYLVAIINCFRRFLMEKPIKPELIAKELKPTKLKTLEKILVNKKLTDVEIKELKAVKLTKKEIPIAYNLVSSILGEEIVEGIW